jgi:hypothetical protein
MTKSIQEIEDFLADLQKESKIDLSDDLQNYFNDDDLKELDQDDAFNSITETLENSEAFNIEFIYHHVALKYLLENDPSLQDSLSLADDMGFDLKNLNSETLASLLKSDIERGIFNELRPEIEKFFNT